MSSPDIPLLLFAKAPIAGQVKTRLQTHCTAHQCADIAQILLRESVLNIGTHWPGSVYLSVWLDRHHTFVQALSEQHGIPIVDQCEGDLGTKMQHAFESFGYPAAVMGADAPHMQADQLERAYKLLSRGESCIGVSEDGGYYFLGLSKPAPQLFNDMSWGHDNVLAETMSRARASNLPLIALNSLRDIDQWQDVIDVATQIPTLADYLHTAKLISQSN